MKRGILVLIVGLFLMIFMTGSVNAEKLSFNALSGAIEGKDNFNITFDYSYSPGFAYIQYIETRGDIWYHYGNNFSDYKEGSYTFYFPIYYNLNFTELLNVDKIYPVIVPSNTQGGYDYLFNFVDEDGNIYTGSFHGTVEINNYTRTLKGIIIIGQFTLYNDEGKELKGNLYEQLVFEEQVYRKDISIVQLAGYSTDTEKRLSTLESWQQIMNNTLTSIQNSITTILNKLAGYETRISKLENSTSTSNGTTIINNTTLIIINGTNPYLNYLSSSDRKNMVCGYAEDNHWTQLTDLGWACDITYRQLRNGKETSSCRCKKI